MKSFKRFEIQTIPFNSDLLSGLLWELPIIGINENDNSLQIFCEENTGLTTEDVTNLLNKIARENLVESFDVTEDSFEDKNWNEEWEKNTKVIEITDRIVIKPSFKEYNAKPGQIILTIDPKMSFGTGDHETTKLILSQLEDYVKPNIKVLDVGSGTAVLAIAALKLGAKSAIAIDNDEWCSENGIENAERNGVTSNLSVRLGEVSDVAESDFDLVLANINKNVLLSIRDDLASKVRTNGKLILSGLLVSDEDHMKQFYGKDDLEFLDKKSDGEWISLLFKKN